MDRVRRLFSTNTAIAVVAGLSVAVVGLALFITLAAGPAASVEAEKASGANVTSDALASGSKALLFGSATGGGGTPGTATYPLKLSDDKHYVVGSNGAPFFWQADTAWQLHNRLNESEWAQYLDARQGQGFNTVYTTLIDLEVGSAESTSNQAGDSLLNGGDFASPNEAYFASLDRLIAMAGERGMQLAIWPAWLKWASESGSFNTETMTAYGTWLGNRYKDTPNIIWTVGGDYGNADGSGEGQCPNRAEVDALATAIKAADPNHLMTYHPALSQSAADCYNDTAWLDINGTYWDFNFQNMGSAYTLTLDGWRNGPIRPTVMIETAYEGPSPNDADDEKLYPYEARLQSAYQTVSGGTGFGYGANSTFRMNNSNTGANTRTWQETLSSPGAAHQKHIGDLFRARIGSFTKLIPDLDHSVLTAGYGNYGDERYAQATRASDGSLVIVYSALGEAMTIDMTKLAGQVTARWYDPTSGQYQAVSGSPFANTGSQQFTPPGDNADGEADWYLVLETNPVQ